ncbi:efflux RND transporter periplasmic adaptor subunit [Bradyrhizobium sp. 2TAF24]|uniref:efflux RND transporter periplasmic adaptor subunit n=1 Tax=Bradyrhizobium sp. 2TAF24 TaxID=3233011 RepID=UPI003F8E6F38
MRSRPLWAGLLLALPILAISDLPLRAQPAPAGPPAVGVVEASIRPIIESSEFLGRIEATNRVNVVARVTAFMDKRLYDEGSEVKAGDRLYVLERGPFEADLAAKKANVEQLQANLDLAKLTTERQKTLLAGPAGQQSSYDAAVANQRALEAQVQAADAQVQTSQINLDYTDIHAPIDGRIGRTAVTVGNVVSPSSGVLTTIVSQDPMYVTFPVSVRQVLDLRDQYAGQGGYSAVVIRVRLPNGKVYSQTGKLDFAENTVTSSTDTILLRGTIPNPALLSTANDGTLRELIDGEFVTVLLEGVQPVQVLAVPRAAVLSDQQGDYVYVVGPDSKAEQRRIKLGQSTTTVAAVIGGLTKGDKVIVEGLQRVRPGQAVAPGPPSPQLQSTMNAETSNAGGAPAADKAGASGGANSQPAGSGK